MGELGKGGGEWRELEIGRERRGEWESERKEGARGGSQRRREGWERSRRDMRVGEMRGK